MPDRDQDLWNPPTPVGPVDALVDLPGSKSLTNRYLVLAGLADRPSVLHSPLRAQDTLLMAAGLRALGVQVSDNEAGGFVITPGRLSGAGVVSCGQAGTVMRFLPPVAALADGPVRFEVAANAAHRPIETTLNALRDLGVRVDSATGGAPFTVHGTGSVRGGQLTLDASASSQFVSGLLLAGARFEEGLDLRHSGSALPSQPHIEMTVETLRDVGVRVEQPEPNQWVVQPGEIAALDVEVEPDLSNAATFLAAAAVCGGTVRVAHWPQWTTQAGDDIRTLLDLMGVETNLDREGLTVTGSGDLFGVDADMSSCGELVPVVAALAALASSPTRLRGVAHVRRHECDRLAALECELNKLGGEVTQTDDGLLITPRPLTAGVFDTYHDHRMAHAGAIVALGVPGVQVLNPGATDKTLPGFTNRWELAFAGQPR